MVLRCHSFVDLARSFRFCLVDSGRGGCGLQLLRDHRLLHGAEMGFGVGADVGEACGVGHVRGLAGLGVGPAFALLEFDGVVVQELIHRDRWQYQRVQCVFRVP